MSEDEQKVEDQGATIVKQETTALIPPGKPPDHTARYAVGGAILAVYFIAMGLMIWVKPEPGSERAVAELITTLRDAVMIFLVWMFGSTQSSARKDAVIERSGAVNLPH